MTREELLEKIHALIDAGDERALKDFLITHYKELPSEVQKKVLLATFENALDSRVGDLKIARLQEEIAAMMEALDVPEAPQGGSSVQ